MKANRIFISVPQPFDFELTVRKPAGWHWGTPAEIYEVGVLYTAVRLPGSKLVGLKVAEAGGGATVELFPQGKRLTEKDMGNLTAMLELGFGVEDDLEGFYRLAKKDALVKKLTSDLSGMRMGFLVDVFERCLLAITLQMTPMKRSTEMRECLISRYGEVAKVDGRAIRYWPSAKTIAGLDVEALQTGCLLGYRARAIHRVAQAIVAGFPDIVELSRMSDEEIGKQLMSLYGIGSYSAQIVSPHRGFPLDVWSARIFYEILFGSTPPDPRNTIRQLESEAEKRWSPYQQHVFVYVINDLKNLLALYPITRLT